MKKDQNSSADLSLPRSGILRGKRNFERLFEKSTVLRSSGVHFRYRIYDDPAEGFKIAFIVRKKLGNAVKRNRIKRLLREVYRTNQHILSGLLPSESFGIHGAFFAQSADLTFGDLQIEMIPLLEETRKRLEKLNTEPPATEIQA